MQWGHIGHETFMLRATERVTVHIKQRRA